MPTTPNPTAALHEALAQLLAAAGCHYGRFTIWLPGLRLRLLYQQPNGENVASEEFTAALRHAAQAYVHQAATAATAQFIITLNLEQGSYYHLPLSRQQLAAWQQQRLATAAASLPRDTAAYGPALAARVASQLALGAVLAYRHRDYCGMGLARTAAGTYCYGTCYDGDFIEYERVFANPPTLVRWLAAQSDYSLAGLDDPNPWMWDNQRLTRQRLQEFGRAAPG